MHNVFVNSSFSDLLFLMWHEKDSHQSHTQVIWISERNSHRNNRNRIKLSRSSSNGSTDILWKPRMFHWSWRRRCITIAAHVMSAVIHIEVWGNHEKYFCTRNERHTHTLIHLVSARARLESRIKSKWNYEEKIIKMENSSIAFALCVCVCVCVPTDCLWFQARLIENVCVCSVRVQDAIQQTTIKCDTTINQRIFAWPHTHAATPTNEEKGKDQSQLNSFFFCSSSFASFISFHVMHFYRIVVSKTFETA